METLGALGKRIATTGDLRSIVRTMKSLSAVSIYQYDHAVAALRDYGRTIELGLQVVLKPGDLPAAEPKDSDGATVAVVFGSDHGLCGRFNEEIARLARDEPARRRIAPEQVLYLVVGARATARLEAAGARVAADFPLPNSVGRMTPTAYAILLRIDEWRAERGIARILLFHNRRREGVTASPHCRQLLPLDPCWLQRVARRPWPSRAIPTFRMDAEALFASLLRQHLFAGVFRAGAESAASEHATRLAAMQGAERNIEDHLGELNAAYRRKRQESITEELLDIVAGFETLQAAERGAG